MVITGGLSGTSLPPFFSIGKDDGDGNSDVWLIYETLHAKQSGVITSVK